MVIQVSSVTDVLILSKLPLSRPEKHCGQQIHSAIQCPKCKGAYWVSGYKFVYQCKCAICQMESVKTAEVGPDKFVFRLV